MWRKQANLEISSESYMWKADQTELSVCQIHEIVHNQHKHVTLCPKLITITKSRVSAALTLTTYLLIAYNY